MGWDEKYQGDVPMRVRSRHKDGSTLSSSYYPPIYEPDLMDKIRAFFCFHVFRRWLKSGMFVCHGCPKCGKAVYWLPGNLK